MNERKVAIITGGAQGIGKATTDRLLREGWAVTAADIDAEALAEAADDFREFGEAYAGRQTDVSSEEQVRDAIAETVERFGGLDLVMNNAFADLPWHSLDHVSTAQFTRVLAVNLTGAFLTTKYAVPHLHARHGLIVNIASIMALRTYPHTMPYSGTKGGLIALTHALAISLGPEVRVNCLCPGHIHSAPWVKTSRGRRNKNFTPAMDTLHPIGRAGLAEDIAGAVAFLASDDAAFVTGQSWIIDGGLLTKLTTGGAGAL